MDQLLRSGIEKDQFIYQLTSFVNNRIVVTSPFCRDELRSAQFGDDLFKNQITRNVKKMQRLERRKFTEIK